MLDVLQRMPVYRSVFYYRYLVFVNVSRMLGFDGLTTLPVGIFGDMEALAYL